MERDKVDLGAGLFILLAAAALVFIAVRTANFSNVGALDTYRINVYFENIGALRIESPVKSSGIIVGRVSELSLDSENYEALAVLDMATGYEFPDDSSFSIVSTNLLGDQYINIEAGGSDTLLAADDTVAGNSAIILEDLISKFLFDKAAEEEI